MRLRQIALVANDLEQAHDDIAAVLGLAYAYLDPAVGKYGLRNLVFPVGDTFLEVVSPQIAGTTAGRLLEKRGGDGGYMVILQVDDVVAARDRARSNDVRIVDQVDREGAAMTHLHPKDTGGAILSLDYMDPASRWDWGGPHWQQHMKTDTACLIVAAELQANHPASMATRWAEVIGLRAEIAADVCQIQLTGGEIRFVEIDDGRGEGLAAFDVLVRDMDAVRAVAEQRGMLNQDGVIMIAGTRVHLREHYSSEKP